MHEFIEALIKTRQLRLEGYRSVNGILDKIGVRFVHLWRQPQGSIAGSRDRQ